MKKRIITVFLILTSLLVLTTLSAITANAEVDGGYEYTADESNATITSYIGNEEVVSIPSSLGGKAVVSIAAGAFENCTSVKSLTIPSSVTSVGSGAFRYCTSLETVVVNASITSLPEQIFSCCTALKNVTLPGDLKSIGMRSFYGCTALKEFTVGASVTSIGNEALSGCDSLTEIKVKSENTAFSASDGILFSHDGKTLICFPSGIAGDYTVPDTVTAIGSFAFGNANKVTSVTIPAGVTSIGTGAFISAKALRSIAIPASVTSIGFNAFNSCKLLNTAYIMRSSIAEAYLKSNNPDTAIVYLDDVSFGDYELTSDVSILAGTGKMAVTVSLSKNIGFAGLTFVMNFDPSKIELDEVTKGELIECTLNTDEPEIQLSSLNNVKFFCVNPDNITKTGDLFTLTFKKVSDFETTDITFDITSFYNDDIASILPFIKVENITLKGNVPVKFHSCGGTFTSGTDPLTSNLIDAFPEVTRDPDGLNGWFTAQNEGEGDKIEVGAKVAPDSITDLYAHWSSDGHTVSFDACGGGNISKTITVYTGSTYGTLPTPVRTGYDFDGWYTAAIGGDKIEATTTVTAAVDQTLYAHWTPKTYKVTLNTCGGTCDRSELTATYNLPYGVLPTAKKENAVFAGWFTAENGGEEITAETVFTSDKDITVYAHWQSNAGDVNGDGIIDIKDLVILSQYLAKWDIELNLNAADCNADEKVDIRDIVLLSQYLANWNVTLG